MYPKTTVLFEIIRALLVFYEMAAAAQEGKAPLKVGVSLETFNDRTTDDDIEACPRGPADMAKEFLDHIYNGSERPDWLGGE